MKAGFSKRNISPQMGIVMAGHPGIKQAKQLRDDLFVRALALANDHATLLFISADVLFVDAPSVAAIKKHIDARAGIAPGHVFISATHTHSGPMTTPLFGSDSEGIYVTQLENAALLAALEALSRLEEAAIRFGESALSGYAFCARFIMRDGSVQTHPWKDDPRIAAPESLAEETVALLSIHHAAGGLMGGIVNYANHPQVMERQSPAISADFPGSMERNVNRDAPEAVMLFINGACGDVCPVNAQDATRAEVGGIWLEKLGAALSQSVKKALATSAPCAGDALRAVSACVTLALRDVPRETLDRAEAFLKEHDEKDDLPVSNYGVEGMASGFLSLEDYLHTDAWLVQEYRDLIALARMRAASPAEQVPLHAALVGDVALVMLPFEVFTEVGMAIRAGSPFEKTLVLELVNGSYGYLPTEKAFARAGGYETRTLRSSRFARESAGQVTEKALEMLRTLWEEVKA